ncbi:MAG: glucose-6-phosphate dehydrogenase [Gemmatimonadetes bacterium]|jgi:glucose-6-phosphate 1-dehydrogenase|nr:glucose-6-phosphate dehydrogenase [Gemmatimonadota bacterium]
MSGTFVLPERMPDPCVLIIFGASGDLTRRKLVPAIWHLDQQGRLPESFALIGVARREMDDVSFREQMRQALQEFVGQLDRETVDTFLDKLFYVRGNPDDGATYQLLRTRLEELDVQRGTQGNRCFYCSVPPQVYLDIVKQLGEAGLNCEDREDCGWSRIIVEKPFGHDYESARTLNQFLHRVFAEHQIYRIDHYLGKETVQNILVFRLGNSIFEPLWNRRYVDYVQITAAETVGVEHRAGYYDQSGALRDMIQNHLLQALCVIAMEPPSSFDAESVRIEKLKVLKAIRPFSIGQVDRFAVRGQYGQGAIADEPVCGYLEEPDVALRSRTETFAAMEFTIDNWRWQGVPFYVRTGKRLKKRVSAVTLHFKRPPHLIFESDTDLPASTLTIHIQPEEGISLSFNGKIPGPEVKLGTVEMDFDYAETFGGRNPEAYETLLLDCLRGDATLYGSSDWIEKSWELLMPILEAWNAPSSTRVPSYPAGSWGPKEADLLFDREWRQWTEL